VDNFFGVTKDLAKWRKQLFTLAPLIGGWQRRKAIDALTKNGSLEAVEMLLEAVEQAQDKHTRNQARVALETTCVSAVTIRGRLLSALKVGRLEMVVEGTTTIINPLLRACEHPDREVADRAGWCVRRLTHSSAIDAVCARWEKKRETLLGNILVEARYVAQKPLFLRVLTALKAVRMEIVKDGGAEVIEPLLDACGDSDPEVAKRAQQVLGELNKADAQEAVCQVVLAREGNILCEAAVRGKYAPRNLQQRAVFYFLTGQWDHYEGLDFDHRLLQDAFEFGNESQRHRIAQQAQRAGRVEWVRVVTGGQKGLRLGEMQDKEWESVLSVLERKDRWAVRWQLAQEAPPIWSQRLLLPLAEQGWLPPAEADWTEVKVLMQLAAKCGDLGALDCSVQGSVLLEGNTRAVDALALNPNGQILVTMDAGDRLRIWSLPKRKTLTTFQGQSRGGNSLVISPDGRILASGSIDGSIQLWGLPEGEALVTLKGHTQLVTALAISPDGQQLASGSWDGTVRLWNLPNGEHRATLRGHTDRVTSLAMSADGHLLASGSYDHTVRLWGLLEAKALTTLSDQPQNVVALAISPDGRILACGYNHKKVIRLWDLPEGKALAPLPGHTGQVTTLAVSPNSQILASGSWDNTIRLWQLPDGKALATFSGHSQGVTALAISPDGRRLASGSQDKTVRLWNLEIFQGLSRLCRLPIGKTNLTDLTWVENSLRDDEPVATERSWLEFILALLRWRRRFDIQLEAAPRNIEVGEFDIEIDR